MNYRIHIITSPLYMLILCICVSAQDKSVQTFKFGAAADSAAKTGSIKRAPIRVAKNNVQTSKQDSVVIDKKEDLNKASEPSQGAAGENGTKTSSAQKNKNAKPVSPKAHEQESSLYVIDEIQVVIYTDEVNIVTKSDIDRPPIGAAVRTKVDIIFERLVYADAKKHKIMPDEDAVDKYLAMIQKNYNLKPEELEYIFTSAGYSFEEGREQLRVMQSVNTMFDFKIRGNLIVPRKDVEAYYADYPEYHEARYFLSIAVVPFDFTKKTEEQRGELIRAVQNDAIGKMVQWAEPFWINESEIAADKQFITRLREGRISNPQKASNGFELYKMIEIKPRSLKTLDERYREIVDILRKPKYEELLGIYRKQLFDAASIIYF